MRHHTRRSVRCVADGHKLKFAREQRREPTQSEQRLWQHLRRHGLGLPFRRQHPIGDFVLDFYCAPARLAVEAGSPQGWHRYVGDRGDVLGVDRFGASAPGSEMLERYGFTVDNVCARARKLLGKEKS